MKPGKVYLVGAGPGDPGLITLKALDCLNRADVLIYDRLIDDSLLDYAPPQVEKIYAGKITADHTMPQREINRLLVQKAREGKVVVRLKGGDPFVFGRGGEEAEELTKNGIAFEVVPGITSAIAVPAYAGIPVTHRGLASSFAVITGHQDAANSVIKTIPSAEADTLVFLMGMQNLTEIIAQLREQGRSAATPVAVIQDGATPRQKVVTGTLEGIVRRIRDEEIKPPAVIVVGEVVKLREVMQWYDKLPLFGKRILVTRDRNQAGKLSKILIERGALPVELPSIIIQPLPDNREFEQAIQNIALYQWLVFTSVNGVAAFYQTMEKLGLDSRALSHLKLAVIGPVTAEALQQRGITADCQPDVFSSQALITALKKRDITGQRCLLPRADIADKELSKGLAALGVEVHEISVYQTRPDTESITRVKEMLISRQIDIITFTSSSTVSYLVNALDSANLAKGVKIACIGPKTAATATQLGLEPDIIAEEYTIVGLVEALEDYFRKESHG